MYKYGQYCLVAKAAEIPGDHFAYSKAAATVRAIIAEMAVVQ